MDGVVWLVLSTGVVLVVVNLGVGGVALWSRRTGLRAAERLIASGALDVYHAAWLTGPGYARRGAWARTWVREADAAETALRSLVAAGLVRLDPDEGLVRSGGEGAVPPEHPLTLVAWRFACGAWSAGRPVTVKSLVDHPAFKAACAAHAERLHDCLPAYRTRRDDRAERVPSAAGVIATAWVTLNSWLLTAPLVFGRPGVGPDSTTEKVVGLLAAALGSAALAALLLMTLHIRAWQAWRDRWPRPLRVHCEELIRRESRDWMPLTRLPRG
ncbi:hypothetical protein [Streptomyces sp. NPDC051567]|uniref:hypothetical protein n=1 Tax=Streptomyces sp. NPDC051567 TaxID=3365660 RepID=UPI003792D780